MIHRSGAVGAPARAHRSSGGWPLAEFRHRLAESVRDLVALYALLKNLRPAMLEELGLEQAIARLAAGIGERGELAVDYEPVGRFVGLPAGGRARALPRRAGSAQQRGAPRRSVAG